MAFSKEFEPLLRARYPPIYIPTTEEERAEARETQHIRRSIVQMLGFILQPNLQIYYCLLGLDFD
jgi:hypothetical protein